MILQILAALALIAVILLRRRVLAKRRVARPVLTDAHIRQLEERGSVELDDPLDYDEIEEEQARFWEESRLDEPEEF